MAEANSQKLENLLNLALEELACSVALVERHI